MYPYSLRDYSAIDRAFLLLRFLVPLATDTLHPSDGGALETHLPAFDRQVSLLRNAGEQRARRGGTRQESVVPHCQDGGNRRPTATAPSWPCFEQVFTFVGRKVCTGTVPRTMHMQLFPRATRRPEIPRNSAAGKELQCSPAIAAPRTVGSDKGM